MTTSLRLAAVAIGTVFVTTGAFAENPKSFQGVVLVAPSGSTTTPTLVQQLTANLAYQLHELEEEPGLNYHYYASQRLQKQLAAALAAAVAGNPLPPILQENGQVAPVNSYVATPGQIASTPPAPPSGNVLAGAANALVAALSGDNGTTPLNPDSGLPSSNPDTGAPSSNPEGGGSSPSVSISRTTAVASVAGGDGGTPSSNPDSGIQSSNPDSGVKSSNPDGGAAGGG